MAIPMCSFSVIVEIYFLFGLRWQLKIMRLGVRIGSMSEACLVLLFLPILRGMAVFRILGIQFEASVKYHIWIGNVMILLSLLHGFTIMFIWGVKRSLLKEVNDYVHAYNWFILI